MTIDELCTTKLQEVDDEVVDRARDWLKTINADDRAIFTDEFGNLYIPSDPMDFDKDDVVTSKYMLNDFDGWEDSFYNVLSGNAISE